ncbi:hypothetical protein VP01_827g4 [Puccinia sorghi]|uniref:Uncharacterized protein n=1 Tax=Puccinia sorghi TaxID=27349 RepID=A0A0L6UAL1_9BASI|nr:hypothetical protein VP01_827g4 [Puccinia sorghi]
MSGNLNSPWFPFKSKEHLLASLILGYMRHVLSQSECTQLRMILLRICKLLKMEIDLKDSVLHNSCYVINLKQIVNQEMANPFVNQNLDFYPEYTGGKNVFKMSQCFKWQEDLSPNIQVQMVEENKKHWYIFEPVELKIRHIVVPIFFFLESNQVKARLNVTDISLIYQEIQLPGLGSLIEPCGHELRGEPRLEEDLSDMCPSTSHCLLLHLSRTAPKPIQNGVQLPLLMHLQYCWCLGAGRTSLTWQQMALRHMTLGCVNRYWLCLWSYHSRPKLPCKPKSPAPLSQDKNCMLVECANSDTSFNQVPFTQLSWQIICDKSKLLWQIGKQDNDNHFKNSTANHDIQDRINHQLIENLHCPQKAEWKAELDKLEADNATKNRLFNPFIRIKGIVLAISFHTNFTLDVDILACHGFFTGIDGCKDTPVEILHVFLLGVVKYMVRDFLKSLTVWKLQELLQLWESVNINALNIPSMKPAYMIKHFKSLFGKDFKIILQVAPFVFFKFMSLDQKNHWMALYGPTNPSFTYYFTCQNQSSNLGCPAYLPPRSLKASIRFYDWLLFTPTKTVPGKILPSALSTFILCDTSYLEPNSPLTMIQQSMGYNSSMVKTSASYPIQMQSSLPNDEKEAVPRYLIQTYPGYEFKQIHQLRINSNDVCKKGYFVRVVPTGNEAARFIGKVKLIWKGNVKNQSCIYIKLTLFNVGPLHNFYNMNEIVSCLNFQHDCFSAKCSSINNPAPHNYSQEGNPPRTIIQHKDDKAYILNAASLSSISWHQNFSSLNQCPV